MKKILAMAAAAALATGVSAYAANPFSDVSTDDWAYQAVSALSDQGVVEGYPDGTFKGERNMTRYELAQIIARLMAREDQLNAEQQATVSRLASEYADELANLGVRVSNLEKKVGNLSWGGNARMRYYQNYGIAGTKAQDVFDGRVQITAKGDVSDKTYVAARMRYSMNFTNSDNDSKGLEMPRLVVHHQFSDKVGVTLGREDVFLGQTGTLYDDEFDGVIATFGGEKLALDVGYGRFYNSTANGANGGAYTDPEAVYGRLYGTVGAMAYDVEYVDFEGQQGKQILGGGLTANLGLVDVFGDYYQNLENNSDPKMWTAGLGFGKKNLTKPGTFRLAAQYIDADKESLIAPDMSTYNVAPLNLLVNHDDQVKYWLATADVVLQKNLYLRGEYAFNVEASSDNAGEKDYDDLASVSLNYVF